MMARRCTGEGTWKVAENVLNERVWTVEKELVNCLGVGLGLTIPRLKSAILGYLITYLLTYLLHGAESFLRS